MPDIPIGNFAEAPGSFLSKVTNWQESFSKRPEESTSCASPHRRKSASSPLFVKDIRCLTWKLSYDIFQPTMAAEIKKLWPSNDIVALVAWLEFCVQNKLDFRSTIVSHLNTSRNSTTGEQPNYSKKQARNKLQDLARHTFGSGIYLQLETILREGKKCFTKIPAEVDADIHAALKTYEVRYADILEVGPLDTHASPHSKLDQPPQANLRDSGKNTDSQPRHENPVLPDNVCLIQKLSVALDRA